MRGYAEAERLLDLARPTRIGGYTSEWTVTLAAAQVHATLAAALGHSRVDELAWADVAGT